MRFQIGQIIPVIGISYEEIDGPHSFFAYFPWHKNRRIKEIKLFELTVVEHHKVSSEYDDKPEYDGYVLNDGDNNIWHNQYPHAHYSQTSTEGDYRFELHVENFDANTWFDQNRDTFIEVKSLASYLTDVKHGIYDRVKFFKEQPISKDERKLQDKYTQALENHLSDLIARYEKHSGKHVVFNPLVVGQKNGEAGRTITGRYRVKFEEPQAA